MKIIGLTGGVASGKSTVARIFVKLGVPVVDADLLSKQAFATPECQKEIQERFGTVDRVELRKIVFGDKEARQDLEIIMHPPIHFLRDARFAELESHGHDLCVYDSPLLLETGEDRICHKVVVVDCPVSLRRARLIKRDNVPGPLADQMISAQVTDAVRREKAHYLLENVGDQERLEAGVELILRYIRDPEFQRAEVAKVYAARQAKFRNLLKVL
jgi:dephospho-CoA kinase